MDTNELIKALAADSQKLMPLSRAWWSAAGLAVVLSAAIVFATLTPRPDIAIAAETPRFLFKIIFAVTLAASAFGVVRALSRPGAEWRMAMPYLAAAPALLATAVIVELLLQPDAWAVGMMGANGPACLFALLLVGLGPLAVILAALRHGAPASPAIAGAVAGLLAGGIAAIFYAAHCPDDSPLFVALWYTLAIAALTILGATVAHRLIRW
ncbi:conserved membrane hypothetical protein [Mesorhizobium metallidurans STM 2683]|uniref:Transmembrane protein n=1 Tax=Mesorhizobium metallidurans STM 2683 TaxID=1297569 RepID=M5EZB2_9HYPH|nr:NrsF family protein [Mesorhizobium metallidurans]CCV09398.1 conserved membrane hypothetical protein [Mesorhizobium metallidurans STM 2683]